MLISKLDPENVTLRIVGFVADNIKIRDPRADDFREGIKDRYRHEGYFPSMFHDIKDALAREDRDSVIDYIGQAAEELAGEVTDWLQCQWNFAPGYRPPQRISPAGMFDAAAEWAEENITAWVVAANK